MNRTQTDHQYSRSPKIAIREMEIQGITHINLIKTITSYTGFQIYRERERERDSPWLRSGKRREQRDKSI